jgi:hypothetical protein
VFVAVMHFVLKKVYIPNSHKGKFMVSIVEFMIMYTRGNLVGCGTMLQSGSSQVRFRMRSFDFAIDLILPAAPWP